MPLGVNRYDEALRQGRLWTPNVLRSMGVLEAWWDFNDNSTLTVSGTQITGVADKSGKGRNLSTGANVITLVTNSFGVNGTGYAGTATSTLATASFSLAQPFQAFAITRVGSSMGSFEALWGDGAHQVYFEQNRSNTGPCISANAFTNSVFGPANSFNTFYILYGLYNGASSAIAVNGSALTTGNAGTTGIATGMIIGDNGSGFAQRGWEHIFISGSDPRWRELIEGYLAWKYGRQENLSGIHRFKNRPPLIGD